MVDFWGDLAYYKVMKLQRNRRRIRTGVMIFAVVILGVLAGLGMNKMIIGGGSDRKDIVPGVDNRGGGRKEVEQRSENAEIYRRYNEAAEVQTEEMSLEEKIGQLLIGRHEASTLADLAEYPLGGVLFFEQDFAGKTKEEVQQMTRELQEASRVPLLLAVDEEGGVVSRLSRNENLTTEPFLSPQELYADGGFEAIKIDLARKNALLEELGLNLNFAPVVDVSTDADDYIYERTLGQDTAKTSEYARVVVNGSKGSGVSYTLKHFPGYGSNLDTHKGTSVDEKKLAEKEAEDIPPFWAGIEAGAEAVMVGHNVVTAFDVAEPSSLSRAVHDYLREVMGFTGVVVTDDISMGALANEADVEVRAVKAGNDILVTTDYAGSFGALEEAVEEGRLDEGEIDEHVERVLAWKRYKGLMAE